MKKYLLVGFLVLLFIDSSAQCSQTLRLARSTYEQGRLHELEGLLESCLKSGFTVAESVEANKLLALAYIYLEEPEKADATMLKILQMDHNFTVNKEVDPAEFIALYNTFRHDEIYRLGVKLGGNMTNTNIKSSNTASSGASKYSVGYGFSAAVAFEIPNFYFKSKKFTLNPELLIQLSGVDAKATSLSGEFTTTMKQKLSYLGLPIILQYRVLENNKYNPYILGGISVDYLFGANRTLSEARKGYAPVEPNTADNLPALNKVNLSAVIGCGMRIKVAGGYFVSELRYKYGFPTVTKIGTTYADDPQVFGYKYADAIYRINCISLSIGYVQNFYNPKKLKIRR